MDYFSMQYGQARGSSFALALSQLFHGEKPLVYGLFAGQGAALLSLSDAHELQNPILLVQSLVLASMDWNESVHELLRHPELERPPEAPLTPEAILARIAYDGRFSGVMKRGPGSQQAGLLLENPGARMAIVDYVGQLDVTDISRVVEQLASLSVTLLCGAHKPGRPAFDFSLGLTPTLVQSLHVVLENTEGPAQRLLLVRGVWLFMVLAYITQLRPVLDRRLISDVVVHDAESSWMSVFAEFGQQDGRVQGKYLDAHLLRALRSIGTFGLVYTKDELFYNKAAWKLRCEWQRWTGFGAAREETLNIRL